MHDQERFVESSKLYLSYYLIRYALSFVCPLLRNHDDTRGCFFDRKGCKRDIKKSIDSGAFCGECTAVLWQSFNEEIYLGIQGMIEVMKALRADSQDILPATSLKGQVDIGIITIREDEFEAVRDRFPSRRNVNGKANYYSYAEIKSKAGEKLRVVVTRSPEQGQGAAQAVAADMIAELSPPWIFLVGIAGGFPAPEYTLGDVLLSQRMHDFAVSAAIENKALEFQDMGGPMTIEVEKLVAGLKGFRHLIGPWSEKEFLGMSKPDIKSLSGWRSTSLYGKRTWRSKVVDSLKGHFPSGRASRVPDFFAAVIITGNALLKDTKLATIWRQTARHASGVEMELGGVCRAARHGADGRTHVLAIRGLSDIVGYKRSHEWTEFACRSAAAFADALLRSGIIRRRKSSP
jgi:nucleoside phosphorylase